MNVRVVVMMATMKRSGHLRCAHIAPWVSLALCAWAGFGVSKANAEDLTFDRIGVRVRKIVGKEALDILLHSKRAEIYRLDHRIPSPTGWVPVPPGQMVSGFPASGKPQPLDDDLRYVFRNRVLDSDTYTLFDLPPGAGIGKGCFFEPGVAVRFWAGKGPGRYVDVLICFDCSDLALVLGGSSARSSPWDIHAGREALLRLAAAALPHDEELSALLAREQDRHAGREFFLAAFPAGAQFILSFDHPWHGESTEEKAEELRRQVPGKQLFVRVAQAFGNLREDWGIGEPMRDIAAQAVRGLSPATLAEGLAALGNDQVALAGACQLLYRKALDALPATTRRAWEPRLVEAAVIQLPQASLCAEMASLAAGPEQARTALVRRVANGEVPVPPRRWELVGDLSARACALFALAKKDPGAARQAAADWVPVRPRDAAAIKAVQFALGDDRALEPALLDEGSSDIGEYAIAAIRARPTRTALDVMVARGIGHRLSAVNEAAEVTFARLTGFSFPPRFEKRDERAALVRAWWREHAGSWKPPELPSR